MVKPTGVIAPVELLERLYETLESLWDCTCDGGTVDVVDPRGPGEQCGRCATLAELRELLP